MRSDAMNPAPDVSSGGTAEASDFRAYMLRLLGKLADGDGPTDAYARWLACLVTIDRAMGSVGGTPSDAETGQVTYGLEDRSGAAERNGAPSARSRPIDAPIHMPGSVSSAEETWQQAIAAVTENLPLAFPSPGRVSVHLRRTRAETGLPEVSGDPRFDGAQGRGRSWPIMVEGEEAGRLEIELHHPPSEEERSILFPGELVQTVVSLLTEHLGRQRAAAERERVHALHRGLVDAASIALFSIDPEGTVLTWNRAAERVFGWSAEEVVGRPLPIVPTGKTEEFAEIRRRVVSGETLRQVQLSRRRRDGSFADVSLSVTPVRDPEGRMAIAAAVDDITEDRKTQRWFRLLNEAVNAAANPMVVTNREGTIEWVNRAFTDVTGFTPEEAIGRGPGELLSSGEHDEAFFEAFWNTILSGRIWRGRIVNRRKDGSLYPEDQTVTPVRDESGEITHFISVKVDRSEQEVAWNRIRFQAHLLDAVGQAVVATDLHGIVLYWNRAAERLFGWEGDEVTGRNILELTASNASAERAKAIMERLARGESWAGEFELRRKDGSTFPGFVSDSPIMDDAGNLVGIIGVSSDISEMKELEARLRQAQKMEAIGRLAGGVAHDFNNFLTAIRGHSQMVLEDLPESSALRDDMREVLRGVEGSARLTRQLLAFGRRQVMEERVLDLARAIAEMEPMLRRLIPSRIHFGFQGPRGIALVRADPSQITQVVLNLAVNAADAVEGAGRISISVDACELAPGSPIAARADVEAGAYARLFVEDTGSGMPPHVLDRIFEPFFTTKAEGRGTGLGLSTVFGIVRQSAGGVIVDSVPGRGSTFQVLLPQVEGPEDSAASAEGSSEATGADATSEATVLVVEDNPSVRSVVRRSLERAGYTIVEASNGSDALELASSRPAIDLVVSDIVMPGMGGAELADRLETLRPDLPVVLTSGYADPEVSGEARSHAVAFLAKPFAPADIVRLVRRLLGR